MLAFPRILWPNWRQLPRVFSTLTPKNPKNLTDELNQATDSVKYIEESATTLYLETDPANRQPRSHYVDHYRMLSLKQLENVIALHDLIEPTLFLKLDDTTTTTTVSADVKDDLRLSLAEALLARDKLRAALKG